MKKTLPYILVGAVLYYFWWKMQQDKNNNAQQFPPTRNPNDPIDPNMLIKYGNTNINGFPLVY